MEMDQTRDKVLVSNNAQTIFDHITSLENDRINNAKRWFWELLQNAKDAVDDNSTVSVDVKLTDGELIFRHTGSPFKKEDILHLIYHGSSKVEEEGKTGRFGTGFMTTHLLSRRVSIQGVLSNNKTFDFVLSRIAQDTEEMKNRLEESYSSLNNSLDKSETNFTDDYRTVFKYDLSPEATSDGHKTAHDGIELLDTILPLVLAINSKIKSVSVNGLSFERDDAISFEETNCQEVLIKKQEKDFQRIITLLVEDKGKKANIAVILEIDDNGDWCVKDIDNQYPKLFFDFPLFGTEKVGIPFVINSMDYFPLRERNGVYLGDMEQANIKQNGVVVEIAIKAYNEIVSALVNSSAIKNLHNLMVFKPSFQYDWLDCTWMNANISESVSSLLTVSGFHLNPNSAFSLNNAHIPYLSGITETDTKFYCVLNEIYYSNIVDEYLTSQWNKIAKSYAEITQKQVPDLAFIVTIEKICKLINDARTIQTLAESFFNNHTENAIAWVNKVLAILSKERLASSAISMAIILNQDGMFVKNQDPSLYIDNGIDDDLKDIAKLYGRNVRAELIDRRIIFTDHSFAGKDQINILDLLDTSNSQIHQEQIKEYTPALTSHFKWLLKNNEIERLKKLTVFTNWAKEGDVARSLFTSETDMLVIPAIYWREEYSFYEKLLNSKFLLPEEYAQDLTANEFAQYPMLFHTSPLAIKKVTTQSELKMLIKNFDCTENINCIDNHEIEYSYIPYFTSSDYGILDRTSDSVSQTCNLLKFIFRQILTKDKLFAKEMEIGDVVISRCMWLERLRSVQWVAEKRLKDDGKEVVQGVSANTSSIAAIITNDEELKTDLKDQSVASFLQSLDISIADVIRMTLKNKEERLQWDMIFSSLITNPKIDPLLAQKMLADSQMQEIYRQQERVKESIKKNQNIGYLFESEFKKLIENKEFAQKGLSIKREPFGCDYELNINNEDLGDVLDENGNQIIWEFHRGNGTKIYLELKATHKEFAEMTENQAIRASNGDYPYVLAVLPLGGFDISQENIRKHARFVKNIGEILRPKVKSYSEYKDEKQKVSIDDANATLSIEDGKIRFRIKQHLWTSIEALDFDRFIDFCIKAK